ncbi:Serine/threonine-protein kinase PknB [Planctomycetes bacterium Pla163]|uniref:Serine/threonine-protein kinase PknB n=1 Tax=Rohdeia mirabilis TaxID=2528008 RepID=A0A518CY80_9BACT|nr:Serine/threonine-protein kinase PknB [Planctomycetes bacterium Pla163]
MTEPAPFADALAPGRVVADRFELKSPWRQGGLSVAFEAHDRERDEPCEVQSFSAGLFEGEDQARAFAATFEPWMALRSERVARVRAVVVEGPNAFVVTDLATGRSLRQFLDEAAGEPLAPARVVEIGLALARGLEDLHAAGLVHGDVKPTSVYVDGPNVMLVDGGTTPSLWTAKDLGERTALIGTPYYAPIEQFGGEAPGPASDIYNVCTLLFELATGVQPFAGRSFLEVFQSKLAPEPPTFAQRAPKLASRGAFEEVVRRGLYADANRRYRTARELRAALETVAGGARV